MEKKTNLPAENRKIYIVTIDEKLLILVARYCLALGVKHKLYFTRRSSYHTISKHEMNQMLDVM